MGCPDTDTTPPVQEVVEYLSATWLRDINEVEDRLLTLLTHLLSWERQPHRHSRNWRRAIERHAAELRKLLAMPRKHLASEGMENQIRDKVERWPLKDEAAARVESVYRRARSRVIAKTGMRKSLFPDCCPYALEEILRGTSGLGTIGEETREAKRKR